MKVTDLWDKNSVVGGGGGRESKKSNLFLPVHNSKVSPR